MGGAESGVGAAVLAKVKGLDVFLSDNGEIKPEYKETLDKWGIDYEEGGHTEEKILSADEVIKSRHSVERTHHQKARGPAHPDNFRNRVRVAL